MEEKDGNLLMNDAFVSLLTLLQLAEEHGNQEAVEYVEREAEKFLIVLQTLSFQEKDLLWYIRHTSPEALSQHLRIAKRDYLHAQKCSPAKPDSESSRWDEPEDAETLIKKLRAISELYQKIKDKDHCS